MNTPTSSEQSGKILPDKSKTPLAGLFAKLGEWRPVGYFVVLLIVFMGFWWLFVTQREKLIDFIKVGGYFPLPEESPRLAFFAVAGVLLRRLLFLFWDVKHRQDDLPVYIVRVLVESIYTPILIIILFYFLAKIHWIFEGSAVRLAAVDQDFTDILALMFGLFNPRLIPFIYKLFHKLTGQ